MADGQTKKNISKASLIDPIYQRYTKSVIRALASTEFYDFFMSMIAAADNRFQFSNRKVVKSVDVTWVDAVDDALVGIQNIIEKPRNIIQEEELIVNVAHARKTTSDVVRHLSQHGGLVEDFNEETGDVRPSRVMQKYRDDSIVIYENRLVFTVLEKAFHFVEIRHDAIFSIMGDEFGAKLKMESDMESVSEMFHLDMFLHIKKKDSILTTDSKHEDVFSRISRIYRVLSVFMTTTFAQELSKAPRIKGNVVKTNVLKKNPNYKKIIKLYEFLRKYEDIGYSIRVVEQNPEINERFERDIYHNILFNYIILKGYLEDEEDRTIQTAKEKKRTIKPKFIHQIIEELTEDYDLPDIEVRKVLIEELTKAQLMQEEAEERRRLVDEAAQRKKEEAEKLRLEKAEEKKRLRNEKEKEKERIRQEKEAEEALLAAEKQERDNEDQRRARLFRHLTEDFLEELETRKSKREAAEEKAKEALQAAEEKEAAKKLREETAQLKKEENERIRQKKQAQSELEKRERLIVAARESEEEKRLAEQKRLEEETAQREKDMASLAPYIAVMTDFSNKLSRNLQERRLYEASLRDSIERENEDRRLRLAQRQTKTDKNSGG